MTKLKLLQATKYYIKYLQYLVKLAIWKVKHGRHPSLPTTYLPLHQRKKFLATIFFLIFIAPVIVYLGLKAAKPVKAAWFNESYNYRQPFSFTHNADISAQRAITFSLDTAELITDGVMQSDCDDTRFTDINGKVLKYELTGTCNNSATTYEVIFESIINGSNVGYVYYGNSSAVSASIDSSGYTALTPSGGDPSITTRTNEEQSPGPVAYWKFDEGYGTIANDSTSNANNGTLTNSPTWQSEDMCISGKCLYLDGSNQHTSISDNTTLDQTEELTISLWVKNQRDTGKHTHIVRKVSGVGGYGIKQETNDTISFFVYWDSESPPYQFCNASTETLPINKWTHISAAFKQNDSLKIYINGIEKKSCSPSYTGPIGTSGTDLLLGYQGFQAENNAYFKGFIDEVKIYPYARTATQIKTDYASRGSVKGTSSSFGSQDPNKSLSQGLIGYWNMDETAANSCAGSVNDSCDSSGNNNDGAWSNEATSAVGKFGNGVTFDGTDDEIDITNYNMATDNFVFAAWFNLSSAVSSGDSVMYPIFGNNQVTPFLGYRPADDSFRSLRQHSGGSETEVFSTGKDLTDDAWHHVVMSVDQDNYTNTVYLDGELVSTNTIGTEGYGHSNGHFIKIGRHWNASWYGKIDEVRAYRNRTFSLTEVRKLYNWAPGPVGHWKLDEASWNTDCSTDSVFDSSGNGNHGDACPNSTGPAGGATGKYGKAGSFDGDDDYVNIRDKLDMGTRDFTISAWVKTSQNTAYPGIVTKGVGSDLVPGYSFRLSSGRPHFWIGDGIISRNGVTATTSIADGTWHHITAVANRSTDGLLRTYIDGKVDANTFDAAAYGSLDGTSSLYIGSFTALNGQIDDVRIYNYARTSGQIIQDMNGGHPLGGSPVGSQFLYLKLDEGYSTTTNDSGYNQDNGELVDGPTWTNQGKFNKAVSLDGLNDRIQSFTSDPFEYRAGEGDLSISLWFKPNSSDTDEGRIISKPWNGSGKYNYWLHLDSNNKVTLMLHNGSTESNTNIVTTNAALTDDQWIHIVATLDETNKEGRIYLNGALDNSGTHSITDYSPALDIDRSLVIGCVYPYNSGWAGNTAFCVQGEIDEVKIYKSLLTEDQVKLDYNQGSGVVMGALSTASDGTTASFSSDRSYCVPGDTTASCSPVAEWKLDEHTGTTSVYDTSGNGYTGTMNGSMTESDWVQGKTGTALNFEGTDDHVSFNKNILSNKSAISISGWFKTTDANGSITSQYQDSSSYSYQINVRSGLLKACVSTSSQDPTCKSDVYQVSSTASVNDGQWHHGALSYDGSNIYLYLDGQLVDSAEKTGNIQAPGGAGLYGYLGLQAYDVGGGPVPQTAGYLSGTIDQVRLYDYALSPAQIAWDYNRGKPVGHWKLDTCQGTTAYDSSSNANHGTITAGDDSGSNDSVGTCSSGAGDEMWDNGTTGKRNYSLDFDGTNDYINITNADSIKFGSEDFSVSFWTYRTATGVQGGSYLRKGVYTLGFDAYDNIFRVNTSTGKLAQVSLNATQNVWEHHTFTVTQNSTPYIKHYINGVFDNSGYSAGGNLGTFNSDNYDLVIGHSAAGGLQRYFDGQIDDVQIFNYALTNQQIKSLYNQGALFFGPTTGNP